MKPYYIKERIEPVPDFANKLMNMIYPKELQDLHLYPKKTNNQF